MSDQKKSGQWPRPIDATTVKVQIDNLVDQANDRIERFARDEQTTRGHLKKIVAALREGNAAVAMEHAVEALAAMDDVF